MLRGGKKADKNKEVSRQWTRHVVRQGIHTGSQGGGRRTGSSSKKNSFTGFASGLVREGGWKEGEDSIRQMRVIDSGYVKTGLSLSPRSALAS